ncbi:hypothetical protein ACQEVX_04900 [Streptomyces syringium]|uniref:hypothetical protein n=1 Tax=Streptomyces syringium TaxID=76729 RepID=UPI003D936875
MIVRLNTLWTVDPEKWADAAGMDPARCLPELPWYISDAICFLPMLDATDARLRHPGGEMDLPAELDGLVRFTMNWTIHVDADTWVRTRAKGSGHRPNAEDCGSTPPVPAPHGRAHADCAQHIAEELYNLPLVIESGATMTVLGPFQRTYRPEGRCPLPSNPAAWGHVPRSGVTAGS